MLSRRRRRRPGPFPGLSPPITESTGMPSGMPSEPRQRPSAGGGSPVGAGASTALGMTVMRDVLHASRLESRRTVGDGHDAVGIAEQPEIKAVVTENWYVPVFVPVPSRGRKQSRKPFGAEQQGQGDVPCREAMGLEQRDAMGPTTGSEPVIRRSLQASLLQMTYGTPSGQLLGQSRTGHVPRRWKRPRTKSQGAPPA